MIKQAKNTICLWYDGDAEDAARSYAKTFPDSSVGAVHLAPGNFPSGKKGDALTVEFLTDVGWSTVVEDVSFQVGAGETLGIVGESGSGKTVTSMAVMGLVPQPPGRIRSGAIRGSARSAPSEGGDFMAPGIRPKIEAGISKFSHCTGANLQRCAPSPSGVIACQSAAGFFSLHWASSGACPICSSASR